MIAVNFLVFAVAAELASIVLVHLKKWPSARPTYHLSEYKFWTDTNPDFGIWHRPDGHFLQSKSLGGLAQRFAHEVLVAFQVDNWRVHLSIKVLVAGDAAFFQRPEIIALRLAVAMGGEKAASVAPE